VENNRGKNKFGLDTLCNTCFSYHYIFQPVYGVISLMNQGNISTLTEEEITFLTTLINRGIKEVKPIIGKEGIQYKPLDGILKENDYDWDTIYDLLKTIAKKGILNKKGYEKLVLCPKCGSPHVYTKYSCPKCESTDISNMRLVEHPFCGYTGTLDSFRKGSNLVCP